MAHIRSIIGYFAYELVPHGGKHFQSQSSFVSSLPLSLDFIGFKSREIRSKKATTPKSSDIEIALLHFKIKPLLQLLSYKANESSICFVDYPPPDGVIRPPPFPKRPSLYDEVEWGQHVTQNDARIAHRFWYLADSRLRNTLERGERPFLHPENDEEAAAMPLHALAQAVYEHLMRDHLLPLNPNDWETERTDHSWAFQDIFEDRPWTFFKSMLVQSLKSEQLKDALIERGLEDRGTVSVLRQRLEAYQVEGPKCYRALRRSDLSHWGIDRTDISRLFAINISENERASTLDMYTCAILRSPYNPAYWMSRAYCHYRHALFDLAIGDAYRAQLLVDVLVNPMRRNVQPGLYTRVWHAIEQHIIVGAQKAEINLLRAGNGVNYFVPTMRKALHNIICLSLMALQSWNDQAIFEDDLTNKIIMNDRDTQPFKRRQKMVRLIQGEWERNKPLDYGRNHLYHEKHNGRSYGGTPYPYDANDTMRLPKTGEGEGLAAKASDFFVTKNASLPWKNCKIAMEREKRYMMVATENIAKDELIWVEIPAARGHLGVKRPTLPRDHTPERKYTCDNCQRPVTREDRQKQKDQHNAREACRCIDCEPRLVFCPARGDDGDETCAENARRRYHFRACGKDWAWLHDAMRPFVSTFKGSKKWLSHSNEKHGTVMSLLLREVFDITLLRREKHPGLQAHEIDELLALEGRADWKDQNFPFTFAANIQVPNDILMCLGVDIFRDLSFDTWVIQLVLQKLLVNAIPWDQGLRTKIPRSDKMKRGWEFPSRSRQENWPEEKFEKYDPTCRFLYLFPGFSFFDHACNDNGNAQWGYDTDVPNRLLVWATRPIKASEEIRISYISDKDRDEREPVLERVLGKPCNCPGPTHGAQDGPASPAPGPLSSAEPPTPSPSRR
ncbi:uncharacterized protein BO97DRAFT_440999 [Aspergillus homomorphus CBS 101889]|uniref:Histone-lysine N-methyltransferase SET5 n=1 Tax=Aspergillus homomorphus (strain CBS 101889) TaxID=1450537 RepID=A0A395I6G0_ASPHC|nr:hypothetical protein BO97DRAFT_440999 [Aspergillus homomorphus CBS 101889]RAL15617.1 hypothetical protein BO97DRAFT_440999 [Aspergillus homomorphus CBS 101889]